MPITAASRVWHSSVINHYVADSQSIGGRTSNMLSTVVLWRAQRRPRLSNLLIRFVFLLASLDVDELRFSDELLLPELASDDVRLRGAFLKSAVLMMSSNLTSDFSDVVL